MPVGTRAAIKGVTLDQVPRPRCRDHPGQHVSPARAARRRPDCAALAACTRSWDGTRPILTDSGGYQVFSLWPAGARSAKRAWSFSRTSTGGPLTLDARVGGRHPGAARIRHRHDLRRVPGWPATHDAAAAAMARTLRWARRGRDRFRDGVGGTSGRRSRARHPGRRSSASSRAAHIRICAIGVSPARSAVGFEAYAIGGLSVGEPSEVMYEVVGQTAPQLPGGSASLPDGDRDAGRPGRERRPGNRPVRLRAADTECAERAAVHAAGPISIKNAKYAEDDWLRLIRSAAARRAGRTPGPTFATCSWLARWRRLPSTHCIICTFTLTR